MKRRTDKSNSYRWLKEAMRVHTRQEYTELFTRGLKSSDTAVASYAPYPWLYARVFVLCLTVFALLAAVTAATAQVMQYIGYPTVIALGSLTVNIPVLILLYELYPARDMSLVKLAVITLICTAVADTVVNLGYLAVSTDNEWLSTAWTAFLEESAKAIPALAAIAILKERNPLKCMIIAASVGVGMAICEDMGYIFMASSVSGVSMQTLIKITLLRSLTSIGGHFVWSGLIGWAFAKFRRPFLNAFFWLTYVASMALHFVWDMPVDSMLATAASLVIGLAAFQMIVKNERRAIIGNDSIAKDSCDGSCFAATKSKARYSIGNITASLTAICLSVIACVFCAIGVSDGAKDIYSASPEEFVSIMHEGYALNTDDRAYDPDADNYAIYTVNGTITEITQSKIDTETGYRYYYVYTDGGELTDVIAEIDGVKYMRKKLSYEDKTIKYFEIKSNVLSNTYDEEFDEFVTVIRQTFAFNKSNCIALGAAAGAILIIGASLSIALKVREKKSDAIRKTATDDIAEAAQSENANHCEIDDDAQNSDTSETSAEKKD